MEGEEDNGYIGYGTPVITNENDEEAPRKKPIPLDQQIVTDERGLRRFHGAFTGGFSAGYFNTVGTKEGWTPSTFVSSRKSKADSRNQYPEDYMDSEDLGVFGIAPRSMHVHKKFADDKEDDGTKLNKRKRRHLAEREGLIPGIAPLKELIIPVRESIGVKLLKRMGWKPGQGIGPRVNHRQKIKKKRVTADATQQAGVKVYGCSLPNNALLNDESSSDDDVMQGVTFAPEDVSIKKVEPKDDMHGLGYVGLDKDPIFAMLKNDRGRYVPPVVDKKKKLAISGEAFGVGVYENEDENIYTIDDMTQYDFELDEAGTSTMDIDKRSKCGRDSLGYIGRTLEGFHLATESRPNKKKYPAPQLPRNFKPTAKLGVSSASSKGGAPAKTDTKSAGGLDRHKMMAVDRAAIIGNEGSTSVFQFLRPEDRARLEAIKKGVSEVISPITKESPIASASSDLLVKPAETTVSQSSRIGAMTPFVQDDAKQKRYDLYLKFKETGKMDAFEKIQPSVMTEWEKQREVSEFSRAAAIYKPLSQAMASRFVAAKHDSDEKESISEGLTIMEKPKEDKPKLEGRAKREMLEWHPHNLLCRRFNIANPYPDSTFVGTPRLERERRHISDYFTKPNEIEPQLTSPNLITKNSMDSSSETQEKSLAEIAKQPHPTAASLFGCLDDLESFNKPPEPIVQKSEETSDDDESEAEEERPPMDLFKAIFQDSDSEQELSTAEDDVPSAELEIPPVEKTTKLFSLADILSEQSTSKPVESVNRPSKVATGIFANIDLDDLDLKPKSNSVMPKLPSVALKVVPESNNVLETIGGDNYGPSLPPSLLRISGTAPMNVSSESQLKSRHSISKSKRDRSSERRHKSKHKKKKKKKSSKRHKNDPSSSSSSEEELNSRGSEISRSKPIEKNIIQRLKTLNRSKF